MKVINHHILAIKTSFSLLFKGRFVTYFIPGIVLSILFLIIYGGLNLTGNAIGLLSKIPWIGKYLGTAVDTTFGWIYGTSLFVYQFTIITVFSPINTALSQALDEEVTGQKFQTTFMKFVKDFIRLIGVIVIGGLLYLVAYAIISAIFKLIGISDFTPYASIILVGFFTGFNYYDYSLERYNIGTIESWKYAFQNPLQVLITGSLFSLILTIPFIGFILAPILSTMIGTLVYLKAENKWEN